MFHFSLSIHWKILANIFINFHFPLITNKAINQISILLIITSSVFFMNISAKMWSNSTVTVICKSNQ